MTPNYNMQQETEDMDLSKLVCLDRDLHNHNYVKKSNITNVWLDAMVVQNEICLLTLPISCSTLLFENHDSTNIIDLIAFDDKFSTLRRELTGRRKKDAVGVLVDSVLGYIKIKFRK